MSFAAATTGNALGRIFGLQLLRVAATPPGAKSQQKRTAAASDGALMATKCEGRISVSKGRHGLNCWMQRWVGCGVIATA